MQMIHERPEEGIRRQEKAERLELKSSENEERMREDKERASLCSLSDRNASIYTSDAPAGSSRHWFILVARRRKLKSIPVYEDIQSLSRSLIQGPRFFVHARVETFTSACPRKRWFKRNWKVLPLCRCKVERTTLSLRIVSLFPRV